MTTPQGTGPDITRYPGDEGRDRLKRPSINAPHTQQEAFLAVLNRYWQVLTDNARGYRAGGASGRTETQADWLHTAEARVHAALERVITDMEAVSLAGTADSVPDDDQVKVTVQVDGHAPINLHVSRSEPHVGIYLNDEPVVGVVGNEDGDLAIGHWPDGEEWVRLTLSEIPANLAGEKADQ